MDPNVFYFVSSSEENYHVYALNISGATADYEYPMHTLPDPILTLPISEDQFLYNMTFGHLGSRLYMVGGYTDKTSLPKKSKRRIKLNLNPALSHSLNVYVADFDPVHDQPIVTQAPSLIAPKQHPIVVTLSDKIFVISSCLNPDAMQPLIEYFNPEYNAWAPIQLPPHLVQLVNQPIGDDACEHPYLIESYATKGSDILLSLSMSQTVGVFVLDTRSHSWSLVHLDLDLPYIGRCLYLDETWCASDTINSVVQWTQCCSGLRCAVDIPSPVHYECSKIVEYGERLLLAFSWTTDPDNLLEYEHNSALVRVDFVRICPEMDHGELKPTCRIVRTINYGENDISSSSSSRKGKGKKGKKRAIPPKVQNVHYCFVAPYSLRMEATLRPCRGLGLRLR